MRRSWIVCLWLASIFTVFAEDWTTEDGHVYHNVSVVGQEDDGVRITYDGGVGKVPYYELPADIQKRFGQDVDSLAAKKQSVDQAVAEALSAAANTQVLPPAPISGQPGKPQTVTLASLTPSGTPRAAGAAPNGAALKSTVAAATSATLNKPGPAATPGVPANAASGAHPGASGVASTAQTSLPIPVSRTPQPPGINAAGGKPLELSVANYSYNASIDVCYLDSPSIEVYPAPPSQSPTPPAQTSSLTLRIITDGNTPQQPDRYEVTFLCVGGDGGDLSSRAIVFNPASGPIDVNDSDRKDAGSVPGGLQPMQYASFYLSAAQIRQVGDGKPETFGVGTTLYRIDERGATVLHSYLNDVDSLQPATSSFLRSTSKLLAHLPSFFSILSTICMYAILGSFGLLLAACVAAFILGISRFIKM